jgi:hypothetical protein
MAAPRLAVIVLALAASLVSCSDSGTDPVDDGRWWVGSWNAVRGNDLPLPFRTTRSSVREIVVLLERDSTALSTFVSNGTRTTTSNQTFEDPVARVVRVTPGVDTVSIYDGPTATIGQLALTFFRRGDTLVLPSYRGGEFKFVRR